ncbi:hypothetical protein YB2330_006516 [Saitoella coloradoensis]
MGKLMLWVYPTVERLASREFQLKDILEGRTRSPVALSDLKSYTHHIEHSSENLQFYLWYLDYCQRFAALPIEQQSLAPEVAQMGPPSPGVLKATGAGLRPDSATTLAAGAEKRAGLVERKGSFATSLTNTTSPSEYSRTYSEKDALKSPANGSILTSPSSMHSSSPKSSYEADPLARQPFRVECTRIANTFLSTSADPFGPSNTLELNLPNSLRQKVMRDLEWTTHPSVFAGVAGHVWDLMQSATYPNFIRYACNNANRPRQLFALTLAVACFSMALAVILCTTLITGIPRAWRLFCLPAVFLGVLLIAFKGGCIVLFLNRNRRQLKPYELFVDEDDKMVSGHRSIRVFEKEAKIEELGVRRMMDTLFGRGCLIALVVTGIVAAIVMPVPAR